jgi:hypothetical protein
MPSGVLSGCVAVFSWVLSLESDVVITTVRFALSWGIFVRWVLGATVRRRWVFVGARWQQRDGSGDRMLPPACVLKGTVGRLDPGTQDGEEERRR